MHGTGHVKDTGESGCDRLGLDSVAVGDREVRNDARKLSAKRREFGEGAGHYRRERDERTTGLWLEISGCGEPADGRSVSMTLRHLTSLI
jgi:hypothetical protein